MIIILLAVVILMLYLYSMQGSNYWKEKGVKNVKPFPIIGTCWRLVAKKVSLGDYIQELYEQFPEEKLVGCHLGSKKTIVLRDPELVKHIMVTDFNKFYSRGFHYNMDTAEPILKNLFFADGDLWKLLRQRLTPAFSSGKLKAMFPLIVERSERLQHIACASAERGVELDVHDLMARYATDFIGACGFGLDIDSINDDTSAFRQLGKLIYTSTVKDGLAKALKDLAPYLFKNLHILNREVERNIRALVKGIMEQRNYKPIGRNDFIDLLLELKLKGKIVVDSLEKRKADGTPDTAELELDDQLMAAQVFIFFAAGFDTSSATTSFMLHQLAFHPEAQRKCQEEVDELLSRYNGKLCYDAIAELKYLKMCFFEGMRMFPATGYISRRCEAPYTFPGTSITIDPKVVCMIPLKGIHNDPKYWDNPDQFIPERFHPDNIQSIKPCTYMPFGNGPRQCIGERLGLMQSLAGVAALLSQFTFAPSKNTLRKLIMDPTSNVTQKVLNGLPLNLSLRNKKQ